MNIYKANPVNITTLAAAVRKTFDLRKIIVLYTIYATTICIPNQNEIIGEANNTSIPPAIITHGKQYRQPLAPKT